MSDPGLLQWRAATPAEDQAVSLLSLALYAEDPGGEMSESRVLATLAALRAQPWRGRALVLAAGEVCAGFALLVACWSNEFGGELCVIDELYLIPSARGRGHASWLMNALAAPEGPDPALWPSAPVALALEVSDHNEGARRLYTRLGFSPTHRAMVRVLR